jgi:hypothetical protein
MFVTHKRRSATMKFNPFNHLIISAYFLCNWCKPRESCTDTFVKQAFRQTYPQDSWISARLVKRRPAVLNGIADSCDSFALESPWSDMALLPGAGFDRGNIPA